MGTKGKQMNAKIKTNLDDAFPLLPDQERMEMLIELTENSLAINNKLLIEMQRMNRNLAVVGEALINIAKIERKTVDKLTKRGKSNG